MSDRARCLPPIVASDARILILGSMPGRASLAARQYYAHPRNAFWPIMGRLLGFDVAQDYLTRVEALSGAGVAVWDVLDSCHRPGSLDFAIDERSLVVNDLAGFLAGHRAIKRVFFNGSAAARLFDRHLGAILNVTGLQLTRLPSTSPAHAALTFAQKLAAWRVVAVDPGFQPNFRGVPSNSSGRRLP